MYFINTEKSTKNRYDFAKFMEFVEGGFDILNSYFLTEVLKIEPIGIYEIVGEEFRPDLASYNIYGYIELQFILMIYNNVMEKSELVIGTILKYPSLRDIENLYFALKAKKAQANA